MGCCGSTPKDTAYGTKARLSSPQEGYAPASQKTSVPDHAGSTELDKTHSVQALSSAPISSSNADFRLSPSKSLPFDVLLRTPSGEVVPRVANSQVQGVPVYRLIRKIGEGQDGSGLFEQLRRCPRPSQTFFDAAAGGFAEIYLAENLQRREKVRGLISSCHYELLKRLLQSYMHNRRSSETVGSCT